MKTIWLVLFAMLTACGADDNGGAGDGHDVLPMRGVMTTDPTIVSASAWCFTDTELAMTYTELKVTGSDPAGGSHLGNCAVTVGSTTDSDNFTESSNCYPRIVGACTTGTNIVAGITVSNDMGGVTTASITVTVQTPQ